MDFGPVCVKILDMSVKLLKKLYKEFVVVLICLFVFGSSANGPVLCFGSDGHAEIESALHKRCHDATHSDSPHQHGLSAQVDHEEGRHCRPCVDIPVSVGFAKTADASKDLNPVSAAVVIKSIALGDKFNFAAYNSTSNAFGVTSYSTHLRTVILLA